MGARYQFTANTWGILLEFSIPRKEVRIDVVLLIGSTVALIEAKTGQASSQAERQIEEYALLLHYFHHASSNRRILPFTVSHKRVQSGSTSSNRTEVLPQLAGYWIAKVTKSSWQDLSAMLIAVDGDYEQISVEAWDNGPYYPVPSILEAATALRSGLSIREIAHSEASEHEIEKVQRSIQGYVARARAERHHAICFLTGVPGSGKTLVGLSLAHSNQNSEDPIHFMSGNGPLVKVLQHLFTQESMRSGKHASQARVEAKTLIENVHVFARYHTDDNQGSPSNHAIIFDEAQRAWNRAQNKKKFGRDYSEPEMLLRVMERHSDWATIIALVGGGQEINDGEAGLEEWGRALLSSDQNWVIYASPEVLAGGASTAGHRLFENPIEQMEVTTSSALHLHTSNRSLRADKWANWVNNVLEGNAEEAASSGITQRFPVLLARTLEQTRFKLREQAIGLNRYGLIASSGAARLRAEGLEPSSTFHSEYPWHHWYLGEETDVRSSYRCEVFATEFEIQGLELDWIGLCWGGDFIWANSGGWQMRALRHGAQSKWSPIRNKEKQGYKRNAYRVLLTRARQGMIIFVPKGSDHDSTTQPEEFEMTAQYLIRCGVTALDW